MPFQIKLGTQSIVKEAPVCEFSSALLQIAVRLADEFVHPTIYTYHPCDQFK